ncbi:MAG: hypothetical protein R3B57_13540 [Phycisphaerales bacterium]
MPPWFALAMLTLWCLSGMTCIAGVALIMAAFFSKFGGANWIERIGYASAALTPCVPIILVYIAISQCHQGKLTTAKRTIWAGYAAWSILPIVLVVRGVLNL